MPSKSRWGGIVILLQSLVNGKEALQETVILEDLNIDKPVRNTVLDNEGFWQHLQQLLKILKPIYSAITKAEANSALISDVPELWHEMETSVLPNLDSTPFKTEESRGIIRRKESLVSPACTLCS